MKAIKFAQTYCYPKKEIPQRISNKTRSQRQDTTSIIKEYKLEAALHQANQIYQSDWHPTVNAWGGQLSFNTPQVPYRQVYHSERRPDNNHWYADPANLIAFESDNEYNARRWNEHQAQWNTRIPDIKSNWNT